MYAYRPGRCVGKRAVAFVGILGCWGYLVGHAVAAPTGTTPDIVSQSAFRVCAPPANMPFSNKAEDGFENRIAEFLAKKLDRELQYFWFPQATGFIRRTLDANRCDIVIGYAQGHERVLNTNHYYVSSYVLIGLEGSTVASVDTLSDPRLRGLTLGVVAGSPPATLVTRYGLIEKARPYHLIVDRRHRSPGEKMIADIKAGTIDGGILWGPIGGYFAAKAGGLAVTALVKETAENAPRMYYRITMGVRLSDVTWKRRLNSLIRRNQAELEAILRDYHVPLLDDYGKLK